jgi:predicted tellurium resistance membrane protein TerC
MVRVEVVMDERALLARHLQNLKLIKLSWAFFFILLGGSFILEGIHEIDNTQKWALIYAGSGSILLILNMLRIVWKINVSRFSIGLGVVGLLFGIMKYYDLGGFSIPAAILLIIGVFMLFEALRKSEGI